LRAPADGDLLKELSEICAAALDIALSGQFDRQALAGIAALEVVVALLVDHGSRPVDLGHWVPRDSGFLRRWVAVSRGRKRVVKQRESR